MGKNKVSSAFLSLRKQQNNFQCLFFGSKVNFFALGLGYLSPSKSWRERGTKQMKIPVLLLPKTELCFFWKLERFLKTDNLTR